MIFTISGENVGERFDIFLSKAAEITRSAAQKYINEGNATINQGLSSNNYRLRQNDTVEYNPPAARELDVLPRDIPIEIVYEDDYLAVVNKPKGMVVHPAPGNYDNTLVSALLYKMNGRLSTINGVIRPGIVHRIDKDTSGLLIIAKTDESHIRLAEQIKAHSFLREYEAICVGCFKEKSGVINKPIGRHPKDRKKMAVTDKNSRNAITEYTVLEEFRGFCHTRFKLQTGRTHQIRVHSSSQGHPIAGDLLYGAGKTKFEISNADLFCGQCLHAKTIGFTHPISGEELYFNSELPEYFEKILDKLRKTE